MGGYRVNIEQIRSHASNIDRIEARFKAVKAASAHIAQDNEAYGVLCGWISGVLEDRHTRQEELIAYLEENLALAAESLRATADDYRAVDDGNAHLLRSASGDGP